MKENQYFANRYHEMNVNTAPPVHLVVMLYEAAIRSLEEARGHMERKDIAGRAKAVNKCSAIISELQSSLNLREGGEIASSLNRLYDYMKSTLLRASVEQNPDLVVEVLGLLENLCSAWRQIDSSAVVATNELGMVEPVRNAGFHENTPATDGEYLGSFSISA
ncbi:MAG: flagellar export chaperone FliS [Acidobacteriota bacterium]|jgi:flagellar protein FliS|nr:flagellar export chaperone FliS [Acidobacteriota bacterium]